MILAHPTCASAVDRVIDCALNFDVLVMWSRALRMNMDDQSSRWDHDLWLKIVHQVNWHTGRMGRCHSKDTKH
jgi:hypothetical protein